MATEVATELRRAAAALDAQIGVRGRLATSARAGWIGPHRAVFDEEHRRLVARAAALAEACRRAAVLASGDDSAVLTRRGRFS